MNFSKDHYPGLGEIEESEKWIPDSLQLFVKVIVPTRLKQVSLIQCIVQAARPRTVIVPIPFGVGLNIDKSTGCKQLITHFSRLGLSISPEEVSQFKQSATEDMENNDNQERVNDGFKQWVADVDHNIATLTGRGTFHGMGVVCVDCQHSGGFGKIPRLKQSIKVLRLYHTNKLLLWSSQISDLNQFHKLHHLSAELVSRHLEWQRITYCNTQLGFYHLQKSHVLIGRDFYSVLLVQLHLRNQRQQSHSFRLLILASHMSLAFTLHCCL